MNRKKINAKSVFVSLLVTVAAVCLVLDALEGCTGCNGGQRDTISVRIDSVRDTVIVEVHDTVPYVKKERIVCHVKVPVILERNDSDVLPNSDSVNMTVVQKEYSDDSTYTAYVSGISYRQWPRLDSIITRQRTVTNTITKTITLQKRRSRFSVGLQAGYGYGFQYRGFEPYAGVGVSYSLFPP